MKVSGTSANGWKTQTVNDIGNKKINIKLGMI
jgi:hypothetical protein